MFPRRCLFLRSIQRSTLWTIHWSESYAVLVKFQNQASCFVMCVEAYVYIFCKKYSRVLTWVNWPMYLLEELTGRRRWFFFSKLNQMFWGHFDPINTVFDSRNQQLSGCPNWCIGQNKTLGAGAAGGWGDSRGALCKRRIAAVDTDVALQSCWTRPNTHGAHPASTSQVWFRLARKLS